MGKTLRLQPATGKFLQTAVNGKKINIWLVNPADMKQGTEVDYEDALRILAFKHPVAVPVPQKGEDGKYKNVLTEEDIAKITEYRNNPQNETLGKAASTTDDKLASIVEAQSQLLKSQTELLTQMRSEIDELKKGKTAKPAKGTAKK